jgi:hypothetical protein
MDQYSITSSDPNLIFRRRSNYKSIEIDTKRQYWGRFRSIRRESFRTSKY